MEGVRRFHGIIAMAAALAAALPARPLTAQSLHGSPSSVDLMYDAAQSHGLRFFHTAAELAKAEQSGTLVPVMPTANIAVVGASFPAALPGTYQFLQRLAPEYEATCGEPLTVTSAARPLARHLRNGSPKSVHPTGMAVDIRKPRQSPCLKWMRQRLLHLEGRGAIEATEEFHPPHFHVAVLPGWERHMPELPRMAQSAGEVDATSRLDSLSRWPFLPATAPSLNAMGALLALAGALTPVPSVAAMAGPLTMQLGAPLAFVAPGGPMLVASLPLDSLRAGPTVERSAAVLALAGADSASPAPSSAVDTATHVATAEGEVAAATPDSAKTSEQGTSDRYKVRPGDSLWEIAREHDTSVKAIVSLNRLRTRRLMPGQTLIIPTNGG